MPNVITGTTPVKAVQVTGDLTDDVLVATIGLDHLGPITAETARQHIMDSWLVLVCGQLLVIHAADATSYLDPDRLDPEDEHAHAWGIYCGMCQAPRPVAGEQ